MKTRSRSCELGDQTDSMIHDRIVLGVTDIRLKDRLLRESSELTLEKAASLCRAAEASAKRLKELRKQNADPPEPEVHVVKSSSRGEVPVDCTKCGTRHAVRSCPAFGKSCHKCKKKNHFARMCQMPRNSSVNELVEDTCEDRSTDPVLEVNSLFIGTITSPNTTSAWFVNASINGTQALFKLRPLRFIRLPFGVCSAPEVFQKKNEALFGDIDGVEVIFDDIIVAALDK